MRLCAVAVQARGNEVAYAVRSAPGDGHDVIPFERIGLCKPRPTVSTSKPMLNEKPMAVTMGNVKDTIAKHPCPSTGRI